MAIYDLKKKKTQRFTNSKPQAFSAHCIFMQERWQRFFRPVLPLHFAAAQSLFLFPPPLGKEISKQLPTANRTGVLPDHS